MGKVGRRLGITVRRLVLLVPMLVALVGGVTACSDATNGSPVAGGTTTAEDEPTTTTSTRSTTSGTPSGDSPLKGKDPCTLLTGAAQSQLGVSNGEQGRIGSGRRCQWKLRGSSETTFFDVIIYDTLGIKDLPADANPKQLPDVGKHNAVQASGGGGQGSCSVIMGITESSRVTTGVLSGTDTQKACDLAMKLAQLVEPELPQG